MTTQYPLDFPCVQLEGFSSTVNMGLARSDSGLHQAQRRIFMTMPSTFNLSFVMPLSQWSVWQSWVKTNAYRWFNMNLPSMYSGLAGMRLSAHLIRFTTGLSVENVTESSVRVSVSAELAPSMITKYLDAV